MQMSTSLLSLRSVSKIYGTSLRHAVLEAVHLELSIGEFVTIMGPSGSGKSTLLNVVAGLDTPDSGSVTFAGQDLAKLSDDARSDLRLREIGFVFQAFNLFPAFTVEENVSWPLEFLNLGKREVRSRVGRILNEVGLREAIHSRRPAELSGGEQQRVALARALATSPRLLLADEPTGNLDSKTGQAVLDLLRALNAERGLTIAMVTHNAFAATYGHRTVEMIDGKIIREVRAALQTPQGERSVSAVI